MAKHVVVIGRGEEIEIVGYAMHVPAKIDTGAYRSSIHVSSYEVSDVDGVPTLFYEILGHPCSPIKRRIETTEFTQIKVKNSTGHEELRFEVKLKIKVGAKTFNTSFSLADRSNNVYPVLIGRRALKKRFIVDVAKSNVNRNQLLRSLGLTKPRDEEDLED